MSDKKDDSGLNHEDSLAQQRHAEILRLAKLDVVVDELANGCYTIPASPDRPSYDLRKLSEYAKKSGRDPSELTDEEIDLFIIPKSSFLEQLNGLLEKYEFRAVLGDSGLGTVMGTLEGFYLIIEADTEESAIESLAEELLDYANDYMHDFHRYFNSTNRKAHFP